MSQIDEAACIAEFRAVTDRIASIGDRPSADQPLDDIIHWVRDLSGQATGELRSRLIAHAPHVGWRGEDEPLRDSLDSYWVFDPIDGAYHFLQGLPLWSSSLTLVIQGKAVLSSVYAPSQRELFLGRSGHCATMNGHPLAVSTRRQLGAAVLGTSVPPTAQVGKDEHARASSLFDAVAPEVFVTRQMASASLHLAYVAAGRLDAYVELGQDAGDWLAGALLVTEASGVVTDVRGAPFSVTANGIVAAPRELHAPLVALAQEAAIG